MSLQPGPQDSPQSRSRSFDSQHSLTVHYDRDDAVSDAATHSTRFASPSLPALSRTARVDIGYFDPEGVKSLLRRISPKSRDETAHETASHSARTSRTATDATVTVDEEFDFEKFLRMSIEGLDESEIKRRELGVLFKDLRVIGLGTSANYQQSLGALFDPRSWIEKLHMLRHPPVRDILSGFEGVVRPGEMLLVLGRPGSGCSTLLKTLANQRKEYYAVEGEVYYDAFTPEEMYAHYRGDVIYCPEDDVHFPTLTVHETLRFAVKTRMPRNLLRGETPEGYVRKLTDILETIFGLRHVRNTPVGDNRIRGVSGGEKKRVSISEALATRYLLGSWDNSTRGLDSSTALEFVRALRIATDVMHLSTIVSIYQAGQQLYETFDKVCVIYDGKMAYYGPANLARQYFIDMGYEPAHRQTTSDFLVAVTDPNARSLRSSMNAPVPTNAQEFAEHFRNSDLGRRNRADMDAFREHYINHPEFRTTYIESARAERAKRARRASPYTISVPMQVRAVMIRRVQIIKGNMAQMAVIAISFVFQGIFAGLAFVQLSESTSDFFSRGGILFYAVLWAALATMAEIPALFAQRPIVDRHEKSAMYHPFVESLALTLVDFPITFLIMSVFSILMYFIPHLQQSASQFFIYLLFIFTITIVMKAWFRTLAAAFKTPAPAQTLGGLSILVLVLYTGYLIPPANMTGALKWLRHVNPMRYTFAAVMVNEFHTLNGRCSNLIPHGPGYEGISLLNQVCGSVGALPGEDSVNGSTFVSLSYEYRYSELWRNYGILIGFGTGFIALLMFFSEYISTVRDASSAIRFKRGIKSAAVRNALIVTSRDPEKAAATRVDSNRTLSEEVKKAADAALAAQPQMDAAFSWQHLAYTVTLSGGEQRKLLDDISGYVIPGKLTALMGESGAGKTTLLNVLAERQDAGVVTGARFVNGRALPSDFQAQTGYVQQMDTHLETTTVREALLFSAKMRQPASVSLSEKEEYVDTCLKMCGLEPFRDAIVGSLGVEHRKRTTIGVELAAKPKLLLFLDEPTSGLDSQSAWSVLDFLRNLADSGTAILCTIHQPSAELFQRFDRLLLLRKGGQTVYFGDVGEKATALIDYFERNGGRRIDGSENPAEYMLEVIGAGATATSDVDWYSKWKNSHQSQDTDKAIERIHEQGLDRPAVEATLHSDYATAWAFQVVTLLQRNAQYYWRDPVYLLAKMAFNICAGLFIGFTFWDADDTQQGTQNKLFSIFITTTISVTLAIQLQVPFMHLRSVFEIRERHSRMYSWTALLTSQLLIEMPWNILGSSIFFCCYYWSVGLASSRAAFTYFLFAGIFPFFWTTLGMMVASFSPNPELGALLVNTIYSFMLIFCGAMQPYRSLPGALKWIFRVSPISYLIGALLGQAVGHQEITCSEIEYVTLNPPNATTCGDYMQSYIAGAGGYLLNPEAPSGCRFCSTRTSDEFLWSKFYIKYSWRWWYLAVVCGYVLFNMVAVYAMTWFFRYRPWSLRRYLRNRATPRP